MYILPPYSLVEDLDSCYCEATLRHEQSKSKTRGGSARTIERVAESAATRVDDKLNLLQIASR